VGTLMGFVDEFRKFAVRGNMVDMAIGIAIGAAFNSVVNSLVNDIIMPPIGALMGGIDFSTYYINLSGGNFDSLADAQAAGAATINYGLFINNLMNLLIVALALFLVVRWFNRTRTEEATVPDVAIRTCPHCQMDIPDRATRCPHCTSTLEA
jgi:large conductance mechanosensitive channel